jgi:hypothetical protein
LRIGAYLAHFERGAFEVRSKKKNGARETSVKRHTSGRSVKER